MNIGDGNPEIVFESLLINVINIAIYVPFMESLISVNENKKHCNK